MRLLWPLLVTIALPSLLSGQSFTCGFGDQAACLGYGETVCSSGGKCVSADAACFQSYQCNYEGFTCKSNLTDCAQEYDALQTRYNALVDEYNELLDDSRELKNAFQSTMAELDKTKDVLTDLQYCIEDLGRLDDPTSCLP